MNGIETRSEYEILDERECRQLYNKIVKNMAKKHFRMGAEDKHMLEQLRACEVFLREMSYFSDMIYQRQVREGNAYTQTNETIEEQVQEPVDYSFNLEERNDGDE